MKPRIVVGVLGVAALVAAVWFFFLRERDKTPAPVAARSGEIAKPDPKAPAAGDSGDSGARGAAPSWSLDPDREGTLVLEGQVVDATGAGVGGAEVWLASVPKRSTKTEDDGTFSFDKLVGRTYELTARDATRTGGLRYRLTGKGDPAVIKLADGAAVEVTVVDEQDQPVANAEVRAGDPDELVVRTDAAGHALLKPVEPGYIGVSASAAGFAPTATFTTVGSGGGQGAIRIVLRKGFRVSGRVVDERGTPIAGARVTVSQGPWAGFNRDEREQVRSGTDGAFVIPAVAAGRHTLFAVDGEHAPARSTPITVADRPVEGVEIRMKDGGRVAGRVVDAKGAPAPYATVRIAGAGADMWSAQPRQANADAQGAFELRGLARAKLQARAESEVAASKLLDLDLTATPAATDVVLALDVTGSISGVVVDGTGTPIAETQVNGFPDFMKGGGAGGSMALAGMATASTDGGGRFTLIGLADGDYRLWASRGRNRFDFGQEGVAAKTGDTSAKIVVLAPGGFKGTIALAGASAPPKLASVQAGWEPPTPALNGVFEVKNLTPGTYDVHVRGPEFAEVIRRGVVVAPGAITDLGAVTVKRGRRLAGTVVDKAGKPVAGARIQLGDMIFYAEGANEQDESWQDLYGIRSSVTDQAGAFTIVGVPEKGAQVAANHASGRSPSVAVPPGTDDPPPVTLTLRGFGSVVGTVTRKGKRMPNMNVTHSSKDGGTQIAMTRTDDEGAFRLDNVPEGEVVLQAVQSQMMAAKRASLTVTVVAGTETPAAIAFPDGEITLTITAEGKAGAALSAAGVMLLTGTKSPTNGQELFALGTTGELVENDNWFPGRPVTFTELVPGTYSLCGMPISGNAMDPRILENIMRLKVYCQPLVLKAAPTTQAVTLPLPAMDPADLGDGSGSGSAAP